MGLVQAWAAVKAVRVRRRVRRRFMGLIFFTIEEGDVDGAIFSGGGDLTGGIERYLDGCTTTTAIV